MHLEAPAPKKPSLPLPCPATAETDFSLLDDRLRAYMNLYQTWSARCRPAFETC
jgi:hypothetical protein